MIGGCDREFGNAAEPVGCDLCRHGMHVTLSGQQKAGMAGAVLLIDFQPIGRIMPPDIGIDFGIGPAGQILPCDFLRMFDALRAING